MATNICSNQTINAYSTIPVCMWTVVDLRPKGIWVALQSSFNSFLPSSFILNIVTAIYTVATITI